jgi:DNA polymerase-1
VSISYDSKKVEKEMGVSARQIVDYKALIGDSSDNYPGVPGVGPKTAVKLLSQFKNLDNIYDKIGKMEKDEPRVARLLAEGAESAFLSRKLAEIVTDVPIKLDLRACRIHDYDQEKAVRLFQELGFKSLIKKLPGIEVEKKKKKKDKNKQMELL